MAPLNWGIIGFGEVGSTFAHHLHDRMQRRARVVDPLLSNDPLPDSMRKRLATIAVDIVPGIPELMASCDVVLSLVTAGVASAVAMAAAGTRQQGLFVDFNSISPAEKRRLAELFDGGRYVDGAILGSIAGEGSAAPLALAGPAATETCEWLHALGFNARVIGGEVGGASALKMCRSIFMKGIECLFIESLMAAAQFGVTEAVLASIEETFAASGFRPLAHMLVTTHAAHCTRRADEMEQAATMLAQAKLPHHMSGAARAVLAASSRTGITARFGGTIPEHPQDVIAYLSKRLEEAGS